MASFIAMRSSALVWLLRPGAQRLTHRRPDEAREMIDLAFVHAVGAIILQWGELEHSVYMNTDRLCFLERIAN